MQRKAGWLDLIDDVAGKFGIPKDLWHAWDQAGMPLTKVEPNVPISWAYAEEDLDPDRYQQLIRILDPDGKGFRPIVDLLAFPDVRALCPSVVRTARVCLAAGRQGALTLGHSRPRLKAPR